MTPRASGRWSMETVLWLSKQSKTPITTRRENQDRCACPVLEKPSNTEGGSMQLLNEDSTAGEPTPWLLLWLGGLTLAFVVSVILVVVMAIFEYRQTSELQQIN